MGGMGYRGRDRGGVGGMEGGISGTEKGTEGMERGMGGMEGGRLRPPERGSWQRLLVGRRQLLPWPLRLYVCVCVCVRACVCVCACVRACVCLCGWVSGTHKYTYACIHKHKYTYAYTHTRKKTHQRGRTCRTAASPQTGIVCSDRSPRTATCVRARVRHCVCLCARVFVAVWHRTLCPA